LASGVLSQQLIPDRVLFINADAGNEVVQCFSDASVISGDVTVEVTKCAERGNKKGNWFRLD
jgi:hypothetical protein